jgi:hypothetical protein
VRLLRVIVIAGFIQFFVTAFVAEVTVDCGFVVILIFLNQYRNCTMSSGHILTVVGSVTDHTAPN